MTRRAGPPTVRHLHRDRDGGVAILTLLVAFVLVAVLGMVWNVGEYAVRRDRLQDAADAAAHSAAVWTSRGTNAVTGLNMAMARNTSAQAIALAHPLAQAAILVTLVEKLEAAVWPPAAAALGLELARLVKLAAKTEPVCVKAIGNLPARYRALAQYQADVVRATPDAVERQRRQIERFYRVHLDLVRPGRPPSEGANGAANGSIALPVKPAGVPYPQMAEVAARRVARDGANWDGTYQTFVLGEGATHWNKAKAAGLLAAMVYPPRRHYVLSTSAAFGVSEVAPGRILSSEPFSDAERLRDFTVFAVARPNWLNRPQTMLKQNFDTPRAGVAFAQAETFNGMNASVIVRGKFHFLPWRLWTKPGWDWRARLAGADGLDAAMANFPQLRGRIAPGSSAPQGPPAGATPAVNH